MDILTSVEPDGTVLGMELRGEVVYPEADEVASRLERVVGVMPALRTVRVNLAAVEFMDSYGLRALVAARRQAEKHGLELAIEEPSLPVVRLLEMTNLGGYFGITGAT